MTETHIHLKNDISNPCHYKLFKDMEAIDAIRKILTPTEYLGYLKGCELKYRFRAGKKDDIIKDISKAIQYECFRKEVEYE